MVGCEADAEEIVRHVFLNVSRSARSYDPRRARVLTWVVTLGRNRAIDHLRSIKRCIPAGSTGKAPGFSGTSEEAERLSKMTDELPLDHCRAIHLAFFDGLTLPEIAERLGEHRDVVESWIGFGMQMLRRRIGAGGAIDENLSIHAALYALDALPPDERATFLSRTAGNLQLAELIVEMRDAAAHIAFSAPQLQPSPELRTQIMRSLAQELPCPQPDGRPPERSSRSRSQASPVWIPWTLAAGFAIFAGVLWGTGKNSKAIPAELSRHRAVTTEMFGQISELEKMLIEKDAVISELTRDKQQLASFQLATLSSKDHTSRVAAVAWDSIAQKGLLQVRGLPSPDTGQIYHLWIIGPGDATPVSAGEFQVDANGFAKIKFATARPIPFAAQFAVTLEKAGVAAIPEGPLVLSD